MFFYNISLMSTLLVVGSLKSAPLYVHGKTVVHLLFPVCLFQGPRRKKVGAARTTHHFPLKNSQVEITVDTGTVFACTTWKDHNFLFFSYPFLSLLGFWSFLSPLLNYSPWSKQFWRRMSAPTLCGRSGKSLSEGCPLLKNLSSYCSVNQMYKLLCLHYGRCCSN